MAGSGLPSLGRVKLADLVPSDGLPSDSYKISVSILSQSLAQFSAVIIQFPATDGALLRSGLESARLYFHQRETYPPADIIHSSESHDWCKTSGYYADPHLWQETYDYRPGLSHSEQNNSIELPPAGLSDMFSLFGKAARDILDAISFHLNLRSSPFVEILDNVPLRNREISSSVLSVCCHARPSFQGPQHHNIAATQEDGQLLMYPDHDHQVDKSLISLVKSDRAGLHVKDYQGRWILVDGDLGPQEAIVYPGLALYQATAGYVNPALHKTEINMEANMYGRCSLGFKLLPKSMTSLDCSEMRAAGYGIETQFQLPVPVDDFMQRSHPTDHLFNRPAFQCFNFQPTHDGSMKTLIRRRKQNPKSKPLPPSKRLRLEAQRVLKERVQDIADKKGIKLRFCNIKECESHFHTLDSPCANIRMEIGWPPGVPFVHPHDLPNKAKLGFLEAYEPGWTEAHQNIDRNQSP
ncbi:unnamed protein product [Lathyrus sativus]|nr:unnamed protein product [Lathyrus sativus]